MTTQPEALRLADLLDEGRAAVYRKHTTEAAAKLRRLHEELAATERQVEILSDDLSRCSKINRELLEVLTLADALLCGANMNVGVVEHKVKAAIAKAQGEQA